VVLSFVIYKSPFYYLLETWIIKVSFSNQSTQVLSKPYKVKLLSQSRLIAHGGGEINTIRYSNSLEAINSGYAMGYQLFELDFNLTKDGEVVLVHDWEQSMNDFFHVKAKQYSLDEFMQFQMIEGLTQLSLNDLMQWLEKHKDVKIVTDIKRNNVSILAGLKEQYPELSNQLIPQVYSFMEYYLVRNLDYKHIILTLYRSRYPDKAIVKFGKESDLLAITMPIDRALTTLPLQLKKIGVRTYAHTVNDTALEENLYKNGVFGIYTDVIKSEARHID